MGIQHKLTQFSIDSDISLSLPISCSRKFFLFYSLCDKLVKLNQHNMVDSVERTSVRRDCRSGRTWNFLPHEKFPHSVVSVGVWRWGGVGRRRRVCVGLQQWSKYVKSWVECRSYKRKCGKGWTEHDVVLVKLSCLFSMVGHLLGHWRKRKNQLGWTIFVCGASETSEIYLRSFWLSLSFLMSLLCGLTLWN